MKKLLALLCAAAMSISCVPVLAEETGTTWVDPEPVAAFVDELDVTGSTQAEKIADFLNPESATYVSQRDAVAPNASDFSSDLKIGGVFRRYAGYYTEGSYIRYRVNPGWKLAVQTYDNDGNYDGTPDADIQISFRGTHYKTEYRDLTAIKVSNGKIINEDNKHLYLATHYCDIPDDVYWVEIHLPAANSEGNLDYSAWAAGIMSVSMWDNEFIDELDTPSHVVKVDNEETDTPYGFLNSEAAGYMPQRYEWNSNTIQYVSSTDRGTYYQHAAYGGTAYLSYRVKGGSVAEVTYCVNNTVVSNYEKTPLDYVELATKAEGGTYTYNTTYSDDEKTKPVNPTHYGESGGYKLFKERVLIPEDANYLRIELPDHTGNNNTATYTNWHIGIMSVEVRNPEFVDDFDGDFSKDSNSNHVASTVFANASTPGYIIQRMGANDMMQYELLNDTRAGVAHMRYWNTPTMAWIAYKATPGYQAVINGYRQGTLITREFEIYASKEYTQDTTKWTKLDAAKTVEKDKYGSGIAAETFTATIPEEMYYVYFADPACNAGEHWQTGMCSVAVQPVPDAPVVEYDHSNPGQAAKIDATTGKLQTSGFVMKNAGDTEKVTVYLASYNGNRLVDIDCYIDKEVAVGEYIQYALEVAPAATYKLFIWKGEIEPIAVYDFSIE